VAAKKKSSVTSMEEDNNSNDGNCLTFIVFLIIYPGITLTKNRIRKTMG
jgi:hypothetical protein